MNGVWNALRTVNQFEWNLEETAKSKGSKYAENFIQFDKR